VRIEGVQEGVETQSDKEGGVRIQGDEKGSVNIQGDEKGGVRTQTHTSSRKAPVNKHQPQRTLAENETKSNKTPSLRQGTSTHLF